MTDLDQRLAARIRADGPLAYSAFVESALYDEGGFYAEGGVAGRRGDFITSPEVGPLFGAVVARALDRWWDEMGQPPVFRVVECGAGPGTLCRAVLAARPACLPALHYVLVERSARQRTQHPVEPAVSSTDVMPDDARPGVVLANELLDNLPFDLVEHRDGRWFEVRVGLGDDGSFVETAGPVASEPPQLGVPVAPGARVPVQHRAAAWLADALRVVAPGRVVAIDYADQTASLATRPWREWVRTYRGHERGDEPLVAPGSQDITCEVAIDQLAAVRPPVEAGTQAEFLRRHGIDGLVEEGRQVWKERSHLGDLAALRARSRVREAEALLDPAGLGGFRVLEWAVD